MAVEGFRQCGWNIQIELPPARLTLDALKFDWIAHAKTISLGIYIVNKNIEKINRWTASSARTNLYIHASSGAHSAHDGLVRKAG
jgi:hypothetical protein